MRILYTSLIDPASPGGAGGHIIHVVQELAKLGHRVTCIHMGASVPQLESYAGILDVPIVVDTGHVVLKFWRDLAFCIELLKRHRTIPHDLLYHRYQKSSFLIVALAKMLALPVVLEVNSDLRSEPDIWERGWLRRWIFGLSERFHYSLADHIIVVAEGIAESLRSIYAVSASKISVVQNGVDLQTFRPLDRAASCRELGLDEGKRYIAFTGKFQVWQGLETIVRAAPQVLDLHPEAMFLMVGDGPEQSRVESMLQRAGISTAFLFPGWCTPEDTALYLGASDMCLAPYTRLAAERTDGGDAFGARMARSPLKVFTYLACGRPTIASHFQGAGLLMQQYGAGLAIPPESPESLATAINYLLDHPDEARKMGEIGRKMAEEKHGWGAVAVRIGDLCTSLLAERGQTKS